MVSLQIKTKEMFQKVLSRDVVDFPQEQIQIHIQLGDYN